MTDREKLEALLKQVQYAREALGEGDYKGVDSHLFLCQQVLAEPSERGKSQPEHKWIACGGCARIVPANHICEGKD